MVTTRSSPIKKRPEPVDEDVDLDIEEDAAPEDVTIQIDSSDLRKRLAPADTDPPKLFILPKEAGKDARIITLSDPASGQPNRYLACPQKGICEFTRVAAPRLDHRSTLLAPSQPTPTSSREDVEKTKESESNSSIAQGYFSRSTEIFVATPVDPSFILVPMLAPANSKNQKQLFVTFDDHIDSTTGMLRQLLRQDSFRKHFESQLDGICDKVEAGEDSMYRLSFDKLAALVVAKAKRLVKQGLPPSMEEKFIREALQAPILSIKREDTVVATTDKNTGDSQSTGVASQTTTATQKDSQSTTFSEVSAATSMTSISISQDDVLLDAPTTTNAPTEEVRNLLRLRTALQYIQSCYLPPHIRTALETLVPGLIDFAPLDAHLKYLASLHEEARALRSLSDNITRKRGMDDDEMAEERAEKRRKKDEEEKRKKMESTALKQLKKVDTSGMKKLSTFFQKAPAKKKT